MQRLFIALDLPEAIKTQLKTLCAGLVGAKWVSYSQMHLTLRFIGDADATQQAHIQTGLASIHATPFTMVLQGISQFSPNGKLRVIWVGIEAEAGLYDLQKKIERVIADSGFEPADHAFSPHITLARFRTPPSADTIQHYMALHQSFMSDAFAVDGFILYSSQLAPNGSIYHQEGTFPLA